MIKRFVVYRPNPPANYVKEGYANPPDQIQVEGVVFTDGTCVVRWRTSTGSTSVWASFEDFMKIHGHPEYHTRVEWLDGNELGYFCPKCGTKLDVPRDEKCPKCGKEFTQMENQL